MPAIVEAMLLRGLVMFVRLGSRALSATVFVLAVSASSGAMAQNCGLLPGANVGVVAPGGDWKTVYGAGIAGANAVAATISATNTAFLTHSTAFISAPGDAPPDSQGGASPGALINAVLCVRKAVFVALIVAATAFAPAIPAPYTVFQSPPGATTPTFAPGKRPQFCAIAPDDAETASTKTVALNA